MHYHKLSTSGLITGYNPGPIALQSLMQKTTEMAIKILYLCNLLRK
jgi:hypothetical protein